MRVGEKGWTYDLIFDLEKTCFINTSATWATQRKPDLGYDVLVKRTKQGYEVRDFSGKPTLCSDIARQLKTKKFKRVQSFSGFALCIEPKDLKIGQHCWMDSWSLRRDERGKYWLKTNFLSHNYFTLEPKHPSNPSHKWNPKNCQVERRRNGYHIYFDQPMGGLCRPTKLTNEEKQSFLAVTVHLIK